MEQLTEIQLTMQEFGEFPKTFFNFEFLTKLTL